MLASKTLAPAEVGQPLFRLTPGANPVTLRQLYITWTFLAFTVFYIWRGRLEKGAKALVGFHIHTRHSFTHANFDNVVQCLHGPLRAPSGPHISFPEYEATCRGDDDEPPVTIRHRPSRFDIRKNTPPPLVEPHKRGHMMRAQRGLLDHLLENTWSYRWDFLRSSLFRMDR